MSTSAIKLYDLLIDKGFDRADARDAVDEILTKEEARSTLATKEDLHALTRWMVTTFVAIALGQMAIMSGIVAMLFNAYLN